MSKLKIKDGDQWVEIPGGGIGVPSGGTTGQVLKKSSNTDYATEWYTPEIHYAPPYTQIDNLLNNPLPEQPSTSSQSTKFTAASDGLFTIFADRQAQGYTLTVWLNDLQAIAAPAHFGGICFSVAIPLRKGDTIALSVDGNSTWIVRGVSFIH